jgi:hypothetical protein
VPLKWSTGPKLIPGAERKRQDEGHIGLTQPITSFGLSNISLARRKTYRYICGRLVLMQKLTWTVGSSANSRFIAFVDAFRVVSPLARCEHFVAIVHFRRLNSNDKVQKLVRFQTSKSNGSPGFAKRTMTKSVLSLLSVAHHSNVFDLIRGEESTSRDRE